MRGTYSTHWETDIPTRSRIVAQLMAWPTGPAASSKEELDNSKAGRLRSGLSIE